jgi:hypothetical protein
MYIHIYIYMYIYIYVYIYLYIHPVSRDHSALVGKESHRGINVDHGLNVN